MYSENSSGGFLVFIFLFTFLLLLQLSKPTLILTWIPNTTLKKNPHSIDSSPIKSHSSTPKISPRRNPKQEFAKSDDSVTLTPSPSPSSIQDSIPPEDLHHKKLSNASTSMCSESEASFTSASVDDSNLSEEFCKDAERRSSNCKSQADSGLGSDDLQPLQPLKMIEHQLQNNEKNLLSGGKPVKVGLRVNDLNCSKATRSDLKNHIGLNEIGPKSDDFTSEEQLAAMLNRNKLHLKTKSRADGCKYLNKIYVFCFYFYLMEQEGEVFLFFKLNFQEQKYGPQ